MFGMNPLDLGMAITAEDHASEVIRGVGEQLNRVTEIGKGFLVGALGYTAINEAVGGIEALGKSLIDTNATAEQLQQTFTAIYQSSAEGAQAMGWLTQFAMNAPFTREAIQQAGTTIAALGMNITEVLPALGNMAAVMGQGMPTAAQAFMDAYEGRFQMLQRDLHVSKQQLEEYGLQIDKTGKIVQSTFAPAFEKFVNAHYPDGMSLQMQTFNGTMSNFIDHMQLIERTAGGAIFQNLKGTITDLVSYMNAHQSEILGFASAFGQGLGGGMRAVGDAAQFLITNVPPAISVIASVWDGLQGTFERGGAAINAVLQGVGNYLGQKVVPIIFEGIGLMSNWWAQHGTEVVTDLEAIMTAFGKFGGYVVSNLGGLMLTLQGVARVGWGTLEGIWATGQTIIEGSASKHASALNKADMDLYFGFLSINQGISEMMIRLIDGPLAQALDGFDEWVVKALRPFEAFAANLTMGFIAMSMRIENVFADMGDGILRSINDLQSKVPSWMPGHADKLPDNLRFIGRPHLDVASDAAKAAGAVNTFFGLSDLGTPSFSSQANLKQDLAALDASFKKQQEDYLRQIYATTHDPAMLAALYKAEGIQGPDKPAPGTAFSASDLSRLGSAQLAALIKKFEQDAAKGLKLPAGVDTSGLLGANVTSLPVAGFSGATDAAAVAAAKAHAALATGGPSPFSGLQLQQAAGYGQALVSLASVQQISQRESLRQAEAQITSLQATVANLTAQLAAKEQQTDLQKQTAAHTADTAMHTRATHQELRRGGAGGDVFGALHLRYGAQMRSA